MMYLYLIATGLVIGAHPSPPRIGTSARPQLKVGYAVDSDFS
jgi:hypothetical protein